MALLIDMYIMIGFVDCHIYHAYFIIDREIEGVFMSGCRDIVFSEYGTLRCNSKLLIVRLFKLINKTYKIWVD